MKKHFEYKRFNGFCGVANLANTFCEERFLEYLDKPEFIPSGYREMTKILQEEGYAGVFIVPIIQYPDGMTIAKSTMKVVIGSRLFKPKEDNCYMPFILNVRVKPNDKYCHSVSILKFKDHYLYSDPMLKEYIRLKGINEIFNYFYNCVGIWAIERDKENGNTEFCYLKPENAIY